MKAALSAFFLLFMIGNSLATTFVVDSFTEGAHSLSNSDSSINATISSPLGTRRSSSLSRSVAPGTTIMSTLDTNAETLSLAFNETERTLDLRVNYTNSGPHNLLGSSAFEFDFSALSGTGFLLIELGPSGQAVFGPDANRVAINSTGTTSVPFSELNFGSSGSIDYFLNALFIFESETEDFSFTLDEIRVVPEPSSMLLVCLGSLVVLHRKRE